MYKIKQFAEMTGVTVRMLRHYDKIGLLVPEAIDPFTGYRYYGDDNLHSMQYILFFKALDFSLSDIKSIIEDEALDHAATLSMQRNLLNLQKDRLNNMIRFIDDLLVKGATNVSEQMKKVLNNDLLNQQKATYATEAQQKWGKTTLYQQSQKRLSQYSDEQIEQLNQQQQSIYKDIAKMMGLNVKDKRVQNKIHQARIFINDHWYDCDLKHFAALGEMYISDDRFIQYFDQHGRGLAQFVKQAIDYYCRSVLAQ